MKKISNKIKEEMLDLIDKGSLNGLLNTEVPLTKDGEAAEDRPTYKSSIAEKLFKKSNSYIILGRDRLGNKAHGFGGKGFANSNAIDIVVGLGSSLQSPTDPDRFLNKKDTLDKDMIHDAARIYISQRTDLDSYFNETIGKNYTNDRKEGISGIALKADTVLLQGRRNVKIKAYPSKNSEKDSHGKRISVDKRIELITGDNLEPIVKGKKLVALLEKMFRQMSMNRSAILTLITNMNQLRSVLMLHTHDAPPTIALPSALLLASAAMEMPQDISNILEQLDKEAKSAREVLNSLKLNSPDNILSKSVYSS